MNVESLQGTRLLDAIATANERLINFSLDLGSRIHVTEVRQQLSCRKYASGTMLEAYVEVDVKNGDSMCWWLDLYWESDTWVVESSVLVQGDDGQVPVKTFPARNAGTVDGLVIELYDAVSDLIASVPAGNDNELLSAFQYFRRK